MEMVWQIVIIMITGTICIGALSRIITRSILEEIDEYKTKRAAVNAKVIREILNEMIKPLKEIIERNEATRNEMIKELKKSKKEMDDYMKDFDVTI